jgi:heptosyltransferase I
MRLARYGHWSFSSFPPLRRAGIPPCHDMGFLHSHSSTVERPPRILVVRLSALGDLILAQPALMALRREVPNAEISWLVDQRFAGLAADVPGVRPIGINKPRTPFDYVRLWRQFRRQDFDVLLAMQANLRVNLLYACVRSRRKVGFDQRRARDGHGRFVTERIETRDEHLLDGFLQFASVLGAPEDSPPQWPRWDTSSVEPSWRSLGLKGPYVVVHTGTSKPERCWPTYRYGELAARFAASHALPVVLTGGNSPHEQSAATAFITECPRAINLTGKTPLNQLRLILKNASVVVSPDTAAVHLARVENVPVVGLYAVARPELSGPYQQLTYTLNAYPEAVRRLAGRDPAEVDWHYRVHHPDAMTLIEAPAVWSKIERALLDRARSG